jgi:hypothetical protein
MGTQQLQKDNPKEGHWPFKKHPLREGIFRKRDSETSEGGLSKKINTAQEELRNKTQAIRVTDLSEIGKYQELERLRDWIILYDAKETHEIKSRK